MKITKSILILSCCVLAACSSSGVESPEISADLSIETVQELPLGIPESELTVEQFDRTNHKANFNDELAANYASVPDIVKLSQNVGPFNKGTWLMYFNDTTQKNEELQRVGLIYSIDDGATWSDRVYVPVNTDGEEFIVADVSIVELEDGRLRLYYYGLDPRGDHNKERKIFASVSEDGLEFEVEELVYSSMEAVNNPEVLYAGGEWYLFLTVVDEKTGFARSGDPLSFEGFTEMEDIGILGAAAKGDDIYVYGCNGAISEWEFANDDITHVRDIQMKGCDPAPFFDENGELHMAVKVF